MVVLPAEAVHIPEIVTIWEEFMDFHRSLDPFFTLREDAAARFQGWAAGLLQNPKVLVFVALDQERVLGYVMSQIVDYPPIYLYKNYGQLMDMAVRPELRRRGLGSLLLAEALRWFKGRGIERVELSVAARNPIGYPFWKKHGFADYMHVLYLNLPPRETSGP